MAKGKLGTIVQVLGGTVMIGLMAFLLAELRRLEDRVGRLEGEAATAARASRSETASRPSIRPGGDGGASRGGGVTAPAADGVAPLGSVQDDLRRLNDLVAGLESRVGGMTDRTERIESEVAAAKARIEQGIAAVAEAGGTTAQAAEKAAQAEAMNHAGTKAWLEMELEKMADVVGLTDVQRERARALVAELMEQFFPRDGDAQANWSKWGEFQKEWTDRMKGMMTSEQQNEYSRYQRKQADDQARQSTAWTVGTLEEACGLNSSQRERIRERVQSYYGDMLAQYYGGGQADPQASAGSYKALKDSIRAELSADQVPKFEQWAQQYLQGWAGGEGQEGDGSGK